MSAQAAVIDLDAAAQAARAPWRRSAACAGLASLMYPPDIADDVRAAKDLCWICPVLTQCRAWVLAEPHELDPGGVCGGMTERERKGMRIRRGMARRKEAS